MAIDLVVVASDIERGANRIGLGPIAVLAHPVYSRGDRTRGIQFSDTVRKFFSDTGAAGVATLVDFISDAPHYDGRMIAVAQDHRVDVVFPLVFEDGAVVEFVFTFFPA